MHKLSAPQSSLLSRSEPLRHPHFFRREGRAFPAGAKALPFPINTAPQFSANDQSTGGTQRIVVAGGAFYGRGPYSPRNPYPKRSRPRTHTRLVTH